MKPIKLPLLLGGFIALTLAQPVLAAKPVNNKTSSTGQTTSSYSPLGLVSENYKFRTSAGGDDCLGEDDALEWQAIGDLQPGESFSFTPKVPGCVGHPAAIAVSASWQGSVLELTSQVPDNDFASWDDSQRGRRIVAPTVGNSAQLCMFPHYRLEDAYYTVTITNVGDSLASGIELKGLSKNDWPLFYYPYCINADADGDGWNDSLEHTMANLVYPNGYIDGVYQPYILWGSNYLSADVRTLEKNDEIDSSPADFNDDGIIDSLDIEILRRNLGQGNGIPLQDISPNIQDAGFIWHNSFPWRRYDLDGDGYVDGTDLNIVELLEGQILPMLDDAIPPTARVLDPAEGGTVSKGGQYMIRGHVWDNAGVARVEYLVNGKVICSQTEPLPSFGYRSPFHYCWWTVPKRSGFYELSIRVTDGAGLVGLSAPLTVMAE